MTATVRDWALGETYEVPDTLGSSWIDAGVAVEVKSVEKPARNKSMKGRKSRKVKNDDSDANTRRAGPSVVLGGRSEDVS